MEQNDKIIDQFKALAQQDDNQTFPAMEKVWNKVEHKLDKKMLKKQNNLWKKLAIAASVLLFASVTYRYFRPEEEKIIVPNNQTVEQKNIKQEAPKEITVTPKPNSEIVKNADKVLEKQLKKPEAVAITPQNTAKDVSIKKTEQNNTYNAATANDDAAWLINRKFDSRGVVYQEMPQAAAESTTTIEKEKQETKKENPIIIVDGKVQNNADLENEEVQTITHLPNPLYIINGVYYTEQEVFGPNPTSPYSPIKKQKIETITVLEPEKAQKIYGEKGKEGIVIITTKNGKPVEKKK